MPAIVRPCLCKSGYCSTCSPGWGHGVRLRMVDGVASFQTFRPIMLTLTCDPKRFASPEAAVEHVHRGSRVAKVMHEMKAAGHIHGGRYVWVVEFHQSGWPHWHVAVDSAFVPHAELEAEWNRRGPAGQMGFVWCGKKRFGNRLHAALYMSKYLIKEPMYGWPEWLKQSREVYRRYGASKGLLKPQAPRVYEDEVLEKLLAFFERKGRKHWDEVLRAAKQARKTLGERLEECGQQVAVFGDAKFAEKFAGVLGLPLKFICDLCGVDHMRRPVRITWKQCQWLFSPDFQAVVEHYERERGVYV